jgi:ubiquinone/menaquinone biosynthesis C-methylase UbiE
VQSVTENIGTDYEVAVQNIAQRVKDIDTEEASKIFAELQTFELGRYLILNQSLNGFWTHYCVAEQATNRKQKDFFGLTDTENFILNEAPVMLATQERFLIFRKYIQEKLTNNIKLASVPCGLMDDLIGLNFSAHQGVTITGIDVDSHSIKLAEENAQNNPAANYNFKCADAWNLTEYTQQFDLLTSNGLNIYVPEIEDEQRLYHSLAATLKPNGYIVTSFLTPPPWLGADESALKKQKLIFADILGVKWQVYRTEDQIKMMFENAGLVIETIDYDRQRLFPTIVAQKRI